MAVRPSIVWFARCILFVGLLSTPLLAQDEGPTDQQAADQKAADQKAAVEKLAEKAAALVRQLDDDNFERRESAEKDLVAIGPAAIEAVTAALTSPSAEARQRAERVLRVLRKADMGLRHVAVVHRPELAAVCSLARSPDGKFLYAASWQARSITTFRCDPDTGELEFVESLVDPERLNGVTSINISPSGTLAFAVSFISKKATLLSRDPKTGRLTIADSIVTVLESGMSLVPIGGDIAPDGKHAYAADDNSGGLAVFAVSPENKLKFVEFVAPADGSLAGVRTLAVAADGLTVLAGGMRAGTLVVFTRDPATGKLTSRQVLSNERAGGPGLAGIHGITFSPDGKTVYTSAGRFEGDQGVSAFRVGDDGMLTRLQAILADKQLENFAGGNGLTASGDGQNLYASGTTSCSLAIFRTNPADGKLTYVATIQDDSTGAGAMLGAADVETSLDGRAVYVALENTGAISVFARTAAAPPPAP